ncbi:hypothetical protein BBO99_00008782 [Phytophthora kernoviae]|uniref:Uncharacterized protein n=1 Tax=Phytophthora kernoviae TaxID=325452 RepID=A0A421GE33_9STRA|nr:hypothetical protein JM16_008681 [Phytophthora kernoviae]RLN74714.1 hypothetical protein BBO99_00008782 [Phytophthora kernoviae]
MEKQTGSDQNDRLLLPDDVSIFVYNGQCKGMPLDAFKSEEDAVLSAEEIEEPQISDCIEEMQEFYIQIQVSDETKTKFCQDEWIKMGQEKEVATMGKQLIDYLAQTSTTDEVDIKESSTIVLEEQLFECFRMILSVLRSFIVTIGNEEAETAEKHYVECRKSQQKVLKDLHRWLRLARLVALSRDEGQISKASWDAMLALESQQLARSTSNESTST